MKSAIKKLFFGKLGNFEFIKRSAEEERGLDEVIENDKKLTEFIKDNQEAMQIFIKLKDAVNKSNNAEVLCFYREGFRNGFLLALDVLDE